MEETLNLFHFLYEQQPDLFKKVKSGELTKSNIYDQAIGSTGYRLIIDYQSNRDVIVFTLKPSKIQSNLSNLLIWMGMETKNYLRITYKTIIEINIEEFISKNRVHFYIGSLYSNYDLVTKDNIKLFITGNKKISLTLEGVFDQVKLDDNQFNLVRIVDHIKINRLSILDNQISSTELLENFKISGSVSSIVFKNNKLNAVNINEANSDELKLDNNTFSNFEIVSSACGKIEFMDNQIAEVKFSGLIKNKVNVVSLIHFERNVLDKLSFNALKFDPVKGFKLYFDDNVIMDFFNKNNTWTYKGITNYDKQEFNLNTILFFKNFYNKQSDTYNQKIFEAFEKRYYSDNQFYFPLWLSKISNNFGLTLIKPLSWIMSLIIIEYLLIYLLSGNCKRETMANYGLFIQLINPVHSTKDLAEIYIDCAIGTNFINTFYLLDNLFRIAIGYMIFQFSVAFRYKYNLK